MNIKKSIKGQGLPLNTLVIAILVIIVLLVLVVSFTSNFGKSNASLNEVSGCSLSNPLVSAIYKSANSEKISVTNYKIDPNKACTGDQKYISLIPKTTTKKDETTGKATEYSICCGVKKK